MLTTTSDLVTKEAVDRLAVEFAPTVPVAVVRDLVEQARRELSWEPPAALPELVERLARVRIRDALEVAGTTRDGDREWGRESRPDPARRPSRRLRPAPTMAR
jgi:hypothetical protein